MLIGNDHILKELKDFNSALKNLRTPNRDDLRELINYIGTFDSVSNHEADFSNKRVVAVDGSLVSYGASYPYILTCCQSCAYILPKEKQNIALAKVFSPLIEKDREKIEEEVQTEDKSTMEMAASRTAQKIMAELEMRAAIDAVLNYRPYIILLDGGFIQYRIKCPELWDVFVDTVLKNMVLIVGVIEEVSTHMISEVIGDKLPHEMYDREVFYGNLGVGEWFLVHPDYCTKEGFTTAFARFSRQPQVIACDFLFEQVEHINEVMSFIGSMTPLHGRGIPLVLDLVDREVRLTATEVKRLIDVALDPVAKEMLLRAQRDRRAI